MTFTDDQKARLSLVDGPVWKDHCNHGPTEYIASFSVIKNRQGVLSEEKFDLYLFEGGDIGQEVCIRYGDNPEQYISPGTLADFIQSACSLHTGQSSSEYWMAYQILRDLGQFNWTTKTK